VTSPVSLPTPVPPPAGARVAALPGLDPAARAQEARQLIEDAKAVLSTARRAAITEMLTTRTYEQAAAELGVSAAAVNAAVTKHRAARRSPRS
jgi:hypothetical protein